MVLLILQGQWGVTAAEEEEENQRIQEFQESIPKMCSQLRILTHFYQVHIRVTERCHCHSASCAVGTAGVLGHCSQGSTSLCVRSSQRCPGPPGMRGCLLVARQGGSLGWLLCWWCVGALGWLEYISAPSGICVSQSRAHSVPQPAGERCAGRRGQAR